MQPTNWAARKKLFVLGGGNKIAMDASGANLSHFPQSRDPSFQKMALNTRRLKPWFLKNSLKCAKGMALSQSARGYMGVHLFFGDPPRMAVFLWFPLKNLRCCRSPSKRFNCSYDAAGVCAVLQHLAGECTVLRGRS